MSEEPTRGAFMGMLVASAAAATAAPAAAARGSQPNVIFIIADQHRGDALSAAGAPIVRTPALDNFARSGIRFTRAYTTMALCSPARTSIMTGLYPHTHKIVSNTHGAGSVSSEVSPKHAMWSEVLQRAGYRAGYVGRWDVGTLQAGEVDGRPSPKEPGGMHRWTPLDYGFREAVSAHMPYRADQLSHASPLSLELALEQAGIVGGGRAPF